MFARHLTQVVFWAAFLLTLASTSLTMAYRDDVLLLLLLSAVANLVALYRNERGGFVRSKELRRAYEPPRHFNTVQLAALFLGVLAQFTLGAYVLIS